MFYNRLGKVYRHNSKLARRQLIECYRLYDRDLPEFPLIIDVYGGQIYVAEYNARHHLSEEEHEHWLEESCAVIAVITAVPNDRIYIKERKRKMHRGDQYLKTGDEKVFFEVKEGGLQFLINLTDYLDTGLFLDHRVTRKMVREQAAGKRVLNLFCYTGSFSVYAAAGGALAVTSVDLSKTYLKWTEDNMRLNGFLDATKFSFVHTDVLQYLPTLKEATYDIIVLDPPTFSNSKRMEDFLDIQQDHVSIINECVRILAPGGCIYFSTNYRKFVLDKKNINTSSIKDITRTTTPFDFEGKLLRWCYLIKK